MKATKIDSPKDAAAALRDLADGRSYDRLRSEFAHISNSKGSWHGWLTGGQDPRLSSFLRVVNALGGEVLIRWRSRTRSGRRSRVPLVRGRGARPPARM